MKKNQFQKNRKKNTLGFNRDETQFSNKFGVQLSLPCPFFFKMPSINHIVFVMCIVVINVMELGAFNPKFWYFIPFFNQIS